MALIPFELLPNRKPLGLRGRDKVDVKAWDFDRLALPGAPLSGADPSVLEHMPPVFGQAASSTCVPQALAAAIYAREHAAGLVPAVPSRRYIYYFGRHLDGLHHIDAGMYLSSGVESFRRYGVPDETYWDWSTFTTAINKRPSVEAMGRGHGRHGGKYVRIRDVGDSRCRAIDAALAGRYPVAFGTAVSKSFMRDEGPELVELPDFTTDKLAGLHAMLIVARKYIGGRRCYLLRNSWTKRWRQDGYVYVTDEYIQSSWSEDFQIVYGWKRLETSG